MGGPMRPFGARGRVRAISAAVAAACLGACAPEPPSPRSARVQARFSERITSTAPAAREPAPPPSEPVLAAAARPGAAALEDPLPRLPLEPELAAQLEPLEMTFVGDVILGRYRDDGYDPIPEGEHEVFGEVGPLIGSDLLVGNLETPLVDTLPERSPIGNRYRFGADAALARHLAFAGFDVMSLANNHAYDMRAAGVEQTPRILAELGITAVGAARADAPPFRVETVEREGWRVAFIALTTRANIPSLPGLPPLPLLDVTEIEARVGPRVEDARASHDLVVVLAHWGDEYADEPQREQRSAAHALIEAGADLVIGHHPHVLQGIERHGHGLIAYSLGNFLFENVKDVPRMTGVLRIRYSPDGCRDAARFHPAFIKSIPRKYPAPATGYMGRQIKERMQTLGRRLGSRWVDHGDELRLGGPSCPRRAIASPPESSAAL